jgi:hypothetical protein
MFGSSACGASCALLMAIACAGIAAAGARADGTKAERFRGVAVRYQVSDVDRAVAFYTSGWNSKCSIIAGPHSRWFRTAT